MQLTSNSVLPDRAADALSDASGASRLAVQSQEIIEGILADPDPALTEVKQRLRQYVAQHIGSPQQALLAHLLETCQISNCPK